MLEFDVPSVRLGLFPQSLSLGLQASGLNRKRMFHQEGSFLRQNHSVTVQEAVCMFNLAITYL
jgi:hypothetical protein